MRESMEAHIRHYNLHYAWQQWWRLTPLQLGRLIEASQREWGATWMEEALRV